MSNISNFKFTKSNIINGALIYTAGDLIASLALGEFSVCRILGMLILGGTIYAFEIPNYFAWIERKTTSLIGLKKTFAKTGLAMAYFNPIWIARHLFFIKVFSGNFNEINLDLLRIAGLSFLVNIPISIVANYLIQNQVKLNWRFLASAIFSALMAIYYAFSETLFS